MITGLRARAVPIALACGLAIGVPANAPNLRRWWGVAGVLTGANVGAVAFLPIFTVFSIMFIGVNPPSPGLMFGMALLGTGRDRVSHRLPHPPR